MTCVIPYQNFPAPEVCSIGEGDDHAFSTLKRQHLKGIYQGRAGDELIDI
jgi:hypothetical protein